MANKIGLVDTGEEALMWYPKQKVAYAKRKLHGDNPAHITMYVCIQLLLK